MERSPKDAQVVGGDTPWFLHKQPKGVFSDYGYSLFDAANEVVILLDPAPGREDALHFIVKAVNSHEALVKVYEAAESLSALCDTINIQLSEADRIPLKAAWDKLDAALSSLKEGKS